MSSTELAIGVATIGGIDSIYLITMAATAFLFVSMAFFTVIAVGPYVKPSSLTEGQKNALIGVGTAVVGATWMLGVLTAAGNF
ncbi:hypothetical protein [Halovivax gelatinilyticus]|uniref:hypothetical protein n=1 Tax=Halovivax gelatinilyticus TaxID=2961597 RepID=UPI0020CA7901|nr:hypothetical protein [Halovivax gelatinilyticus]